VTTGPLLLDTCAILWAFGTGELDEAAAERIEEASRQDCLLVSPISAWEIGMLVRKGRIALTKPPEAWFEDVVCSPGVHLAPMEPAVLIASSFLPGVPPSDPADRIIVATARTEGAMLVTRDALLLRYAGQGHVQALPC
jgi:PIN domain nuclease of toxin-antitoxin system